MNKPLEPRDFAHPLAVALSAAWWLLLIAAGLVLATIRREPEPEPDPDLGATVYRSTRCMGPEQRASVEVKP